MSLALLTLAAAAAAGPPPAGGAPCWLDNGVVVISAEVAGVAGDFILDTAAPQTLLAETQAQGAGYAETALRGDIRLAGRRIPGLALAVRDLDVRTGLFPTPIAGVIGADALKGFVIDLSFAPCRVSLHGPAEAPAFGRAMVLPITWIAGAPAVPAAVSDGPRAFAGEMALATGGDAPVRLSDALAAAPGAAKPQELYPDGVLRPRLRALSLGGRLFETVPAGLLKAPDPALAGQIGAPLLAAWRVRFDFPRGRLLLAPK